ncbi:MAG: GntR family transcriptional regulator [Oscillospiraceae bacterium]|nr:GntR family transcriptional regulator [Oscillospiraceae bacterium]
MENQVKYEDDIPRYQQIALELAARIACEEYQEGAKIYARSAIASQYKVSPETARRAICVLCDLGIVSSEKGSGVTILSQKHATSYVKQFQKRKTFDKIKDNLLNSITQQQEDLQVLSKQLSDLIDASQQLRSMNPFMPYKIEINKQCVYLNKCIAEIQFWQHTGATVLAVDRQGVILKSPGPYVTLFEHDVLYFLPQDDTSQQVKDFLYPTAESKDIF